MVASARISKWLRVGRRCARAPPHKAIRPHQHRSLSQYTHFCLPAIVKIDEIAIRADPVPLFAPITEDGVSAMEGGLMAVATEREGPSALPREVAWDALKPCTSGAVAGL